MSAEPALLAAIAANPGDDLPRLVYADWLDENDRPLRAEFIRLQIEIARKELLPQRKVKQLTPLRQREQQILTQYSRYELMGEPLNGTGVTNVLFRRGLVEDITFTAADYITDGAVVASVTPRPGRIRVTETGTERAWRLLYVDAAVLEMITDLSFTPKEIEPNRLLISAELLRVRSCCRWLELQSFDMENCQIGNVGIRALLAPPCFPALTELNLSDNNLTDTGVIELLNTGVPQQLKRLALDGNPIGNSGAFALARALANNSTLEHLTLRTTNINLPGRVALTHVLDERVELD